MLTLEFLRFGIAQKSGGVHLKLRPIHFVGSCNSSQEIIKKTLVSASFRELTKYRDLFLIFSI